MQGKSNDYATLAAGAELAAAIDFREYSTNLAERHLTLFSAICRLKSL
jgi:hypothetical protein